MIKPAVFVLAAIMAIAATPASAESTVSVPCREFAALTGQDMCNDFATLKMPASRYEAMKRGAAKKRCIEVWKSANAHCAKFEPIHVPTSNAPEECLRGPACD